MANEWKNLRPEHFFMKSFKSLKLNNIFPDFLKLKVVEESQNSNDRSG